MKHDNVNRYAEFCQFRREIRGSAEYVIVGIDVAKECHHAFFGTATGQALLKRLLFDNSAGGFSELLERVGQLKTRHGLSKAVFALEPTGNYHKPLANWLLERGQLLVLVSNHAIAENRQRLAQDLGSHRLRWLRERAPLTAFTLLLVGAALLLRQSLRRKREQVVRVAYQVTDNWEDAVDVSQGVFVRLWKGLRRYDPARRFDT